MRFSVLLLAVAVTLFLTGTVRAEGLINSQSYRQIPYATPIEVRMADDSGDNPMLREEFIHHLQSTGHRVANGAPMVLTFGRHGALGTWGSNKRYLVEMHARGGEEGGEDAAVRLNLFNSAKGGLFNEGKGDSSGSPTRYRLDAVLEDRNTGKRLWHGWATASLKRADQTALTLSMVPPLVSALGQTVRKQAFETPQ
ncbi:hypothetical protein [Magnetospira sp. QH-2]|uniref:hypothetical protein n=1 Tax=Magnetospira sp. (strain QH-2) TaxID=1288970 RepID=UPI0003E8178E|nr:hypothetical protein [Magnetospira sp. QH-2]CCQ75171.1 exported protein of unknown function [Magnetospira sp. QH-2]